MLDPLRRFLRLGAPVALVALVGGAAAAGLIAYRALPGEGRPLHGLFIGGRVLPRDREFGPWLDQRRIVERQRPVTLVHGAQAWRIPLGQLGIEIDVAGAMTHALAPGRSGPLRARLATLLSARRGEIDIPVPYSTDTRRAQAALAEVARDVFREPVDAQVDLDAHARIPAQDGEELDVTATLDAVLDGLSRGEDSFAVVTRPTPAQVTTADLGRVDITQVVSSFETRFSLYGIGANRAVNIARAAKSIDGLVLMPGQEFVFNRVVGERSLARGYTYAPEIVGDELQMGVGGGVCQVASTLYASALYGALDITERWAHGRPSGYTRLGLDATVSYGAKDLRFRNTMPYPVLLHVFLPQPGLLRAEVLGGPPLAKVEYLYGVARTEPFVRRITVKQGLAAGRVIRKQKGIQGYSVSSLVRTRYPDGRVLERWYHSEYRPTPEIFWVSPDFDESRLPALPPGAKGVEGSVGDNASAAPSAG